jgi:ribosomal protein L40E
MALQLIQRNDSSLKSEPQYSSQPPKKFIKRPMKLLLVTGIFLFFGVFRLRSLGWLTLDPWSLYLAYLAGYIGSAVLSGVIDFTQISYATGLPWLGFWQNGTGGGIVSFDIYRETLYTVIGIELVIALIGILAVYSTIMLRRSWIAKICCVVLVIAGIVDVASPFPIVESVAGILALFLLLRPDVKEAYELKEGRSTLPTRRAKEEEVTFKAEPEVPKEKRKTGRRCPKCGLLLPPSAKVCRRCKTRIIED